MCDQSESYHCSICLGMGSMDLDTGGPWTAGRRPSAKVECEDCQGFGQFTDRDGAMIAGPHHPAVPDSRAGGRVTPSLDPRRSGQLSG